MSRPSVPVPLRHPAGRGGRAAPARCARCATAATAARMRTGSAQPQQVLDAAGGTDIVATHSRYVRLSRGRAAAWPARRCRPRGLLRWYATALQHPGRQHARATGSVPYVGLVHTCLERVQPLEASFTPVQMDIDSQARRWALRPHRGGPVALPRFGAMVLRLSAAAADRAVVVAGRPCCRRRCRCTPVAAVHVPAEGRGGCRRDRRAR